MAVAMSVSTASAQWHTETYSLKPGWNAIWLPLDVSHASIEDLVPVSVEEVWRWNANVAGTFTEAPSGPPSQTEVQWSVWRRSDPSGTTLGAMDGNYAYLIRVDPGQVGTISWPVKGKPLPPRYDWTSTGVNLVGFPIETPISTTTRNLSRFYGFDPALKSLPNTLYYNGGELSDVAPKNPLPIGNPNSNPMVRYQAYWVEAKSYTEYYGPLQITVGSAKGLDFGSESVSVEVRIKNVAVNSTNTQSVTVTLAPQSSEAVPNGQPSTSGAVPLLLRGSLDLSTGLFAYTSLTGPVSRTLAPGAEEEFIFTVDRSLLASAAGVKYASLLRITDSLNLTRIMLPVTAETTSRAGLWVGAAVVDEVDFVRKDPASPAYLGTPQQAPSKFPVRLVMHSNTAGQLRLLQQAYKGTQGNVTIVSDKEAAFVAPAKPDARVSSSHFPVGKTLLAAGGLGLTGTAAFDFTLGYTDSSNPFVHAYHPDHDNMDERFSTVLPAGRESNNIRRQITFTFAAQNPNGFDPSWGSSTLGGTYTEVITGLRSRPITCRGKFVIYRTDKAESFVTAAP